MARILLVDDPDISASCSQTLRQDGHECHCVSHCRDAMRSVMAQRPDLVVLNPHLSNCDGIRTLEAIKEFDPDVRVVLYTGASLFGDSYNYFLADRTIIRQSDHGRLASFIHSKFDIESSRSKAHVPKYHVGVF